MAWTSTRLEWVCEDCQVYEQGARVKCRGFINGMTDTKLSWGPYAEGIVVAEKDWDEGTLYRKGLIKMDLRKLKRHREHKVTIMLTGERLRRVQRTIGMINEDE